MRIKFDKAKLKNDEIWNKNKNDPKQNNLQLKECESYLKD